LPWLSLSQGLKNKGELPKVPAKLRPKLSWGKRKKRKLLIQENFILIPKGLIATFLEKNYCPYSFNPKGLKNSR